ncbi:hypothetical protein [Methylobacterium thuringiense]|uniref:Uncharacterized protein n=1 Tax=Methylobacterium thuringiense TaxID=1003091 RepID=A0ABQ4TPH4_9HYPH|nr:hypothetical protein [Methylobacterium thuringiense]GJE55950.1 hypothetical protein EKPJFOCH_2447 [Methylobacterium thuringiense]
MLLEALLALTTVLPRLDAGIEAARARLAPAGQLSLRTTLDTNPSAPALPYFSATARAVSNWRDEAGAALMPASLALVVKYADSEPGFVARCVKLNNYWCIKQARWRGELGGDGEGHTGFATAADGADAAATLLRRYYRQYGRRTALAIVRRWAPAECGGGQVAVSSPGSAKRTPSGPRVSTALAPRGIGSTLRARFLAGHARGGAPRRVVSARSGGGGALRVQPWSARARLAGHPGRVARIAAPRPVADIAAGIGPSPPARTAQPIHGLATSSGLAPPPRFPLDAAPPAVLRPVRPPTRGADDPSALLASDRLVAESASLPSLAAGLPAGSLLDLRVPAPFCSTDETRIRAYADRIATSVGLKPEDDLGLFAADGTPTARLAPVMLAMSSVELGSLRASPALIAAAIARLGFTGAAASAAN